MKKFTFSLFLLVLFKLNVLQAQDCNFKESGGLLVAEIESANIPEEWNVSSKGDLTYIEWNGSPSLNNPGLGTITYNLNFTTTGIYRVQLKTWINEGNQTNEHNDTWLKLPNNENMVLFGHKGNSSSIVNDLQSKNTNVVFPDGSGMGNPANGSKDGWFKIYMNTLQVTWNTNVNDEDPYDLYIQVKNPGIYTLEISGRETSHALDKMVFYHLPTFGDDLANSELESFQESANNCPVATPIFNNADGKCEFEEIDGVVVMEAESNNIPDDWTVSLNQGTGYIEWSGNENFNNPGEGTITYLFSISTTGLYRFQWRNKINEGDSKSDHNDIWMKVPNNENVQFFGYKGNNATSASVINSNLANKSSNIVFPVGSGLGNPANGSSGEWFKIYINGLQWSWNTKTNDEIPHDVYMKFNAPGIYSLQISGRENFHAIDKMVLYHLETTGNGLEDDELDSFAESGCLPKLEFTNNSLGDSLALRLLHERTAGANWTNPWNLNLPMDQWAGVKLDTGRRVVELSLVNRGLQGALPGEIGHLSKLKKLEIASNAQLTGRFPDLNNMADLASLNMSANGLSGSLPEGLGNLTKLTSIQLNDNQLSGPLPPNLGQLINLTVLQLANNSFSGSLPSGFGNLNKLVTLNLGGNNFSGNLPVFSSMTALKTLVLSENEFTGEISSLGLGALTNLETLLMGGNQLSGVIFPGVVNLVKLKALNLSNNQLTGAIPTNIGALVNLTTINLSNNQLSGIIPGSFSQLVNLTSALLNDNVLEGALPSITGLTKLTTLALHNNQLSDLPDLSQSAITNLSVQNNRLTFEDILPAQAKLSSYAPQDSVGEGGNVTLIGGKELVVDLGIDKSIGTNFYVWSRNGTVYKNTLESQLVINNVTIQDTGSYTCVITNSILTDLTLYSRPVNVIVNAPPVITSTPPATALADSTYTYNITVSDPNIDDSVAIAATALPDWLTFTDNGDGTAVLSGKPALGDCSKNQVTLRAVDRGGLDTLQTFTIDITANFDVTITTSEAAICKGEAVTFTANLTNPGPNPVYQWFLNDQLLEGVNAATITTSTLKTGDVLKVKVTTDAAPCLLNTEAETAPVNIQVTDITTMVVVLNAEQSQVCEGEAATFTTILSSPGLNPVYHWFVNETEVNDATGATFTTSSLQDGDAVKVKVTAENPGCLQNTEAESTAKTVDVVASMNLNVALTADKTEANAGDPVKFTATTEYNASPVQYQWFINGNEVAEESTSTFVSSTLKNNDKIKVKLTADSIPCLLNPEVESQEITMTIDAGIEIANVEKGTSEENELTFASSDFSEAFTSGLGELATIKIATLPANGTLQLNGTVVVAGQEISVGNLSSLVYIPATDFSGSDSFQWNGTEGTQFAVNDATVNINVAAVNDPPVFTLSRDSVIVNQGFTTVEEITVVPGEVPASETDQVVTYRLDPSNVGFANVTVDQNTGKVSIAAIGGRIGKQIIAVVADDGQEENNTYSQTFLLEIRSSLNTIPSNIRLSNFDIPENQPVGSTVATIIVEDIDPNDQHQIVFARNDLYPDNDLFTIEGYALKNNVVLKYEERKRLILNLKATDRAGNALTKQIVINIRDVNDIPSDIMISSLNIVENLTVGSVAAVFSADDQDPEDQHTYALVGEAKDNNRFLITGNKLIMNSTQALNPGEELQIRVRVDDGNEGVMEKDFTLTIVGSDEEFANIKTGFTPNGDEWNATWKIENIEKYPNARIEIYDSWGRRVFYSVGYAQEWDGTHEGKELPAGTYYYIIDTYSGKPAKGSITLMR